MRRFILRQNLLRYQAQLADEGDVIRRAHLRELIEDARLELARLEHLWHITCPQIEVPLYLGEDAELTLDHAVSANHADRGSLRIWNERKYCLSLFAQTNFNADFVDRFADVVEGDGTVSLQALALQKPVFVHDVEEDEDLTSFKDYARQEGIRSIVSSPLIGSDGRCLGTYSLHYNRTQTYNDADHVVVHTYSMRLAALLQCFL
ncbi:GAF domain-containing protein [Rhizobium mesosinicum]|uniref:GAF domain-containing protein n=1 Tax=Rhizobium mesosinicum TaxID=335017 RepID=A0ABS7GQU7_9HYPH|nr:GAF domain-containing protein [Rhizobium mesosinicum]MBW9052305.1 GAF domain-containing protein [Rhizobium mesosinicum]